MNATTSSMPSKSIKVIYWVTTGLLFILYFGSGTMYIISTDMVNENMAHLGYPTWVTFFLIPMKFTGITAAVFAKWISIKEWAYAGMFFNCILALFAHLSVSDPIGATVPAFMGTLLVVVSYYSSMKLVNV